MAWLGALQAAERGAQAAAAAEAAAAAAAGHAQALQALSRDVAALSAEVSVQVTSVLGCALPGASAGQSRQPYLLTLVCGVKLEPGLKSQCSALCTIRGTTCYRACYPDARCTLSFSPRQGLLTRTQSKARTQWRSPVWQWCRRIMGALKQKELNGHRLLRQTCGCGRPRARRRAQNAALQAKAAADAAAVGARVRGVVGARDSVNAELRRQLSAAAARLAAAEGVLDRQRTELLG